MTTYIIYPDNTDGFLTSRNANFATAQAGSNLLATTNQGLSKTGMNIGGGEYYIHQSFMSFDTSVIADTEEIVDATISMYAGFPANQNVAWGQQFRAFNWTSPLTTAQWQTPALATSRPLIANIDYLFASTPYQWRTTGRDTLVAGISKTAATKFVTVSNTYVDGYGTNGIQEIWAENSKGNLQNRPYLTVYTVALNTLNGVTEASTTLPDGTSISVRSSGAASPTLTLGYTPLNGSWTSLGTLHADFTKNIDGAGPLAVTHDPAGNFFIIGLKTGTTGTLVAQAYQRLTATTWSAKTPLSQALAAGNEQTIRSIAASYAIGGTDGNDKPSVYIMTVRGSGGNRPNFPYHTSGAGWAQDHSLFAENLLAGSGTLLKMTTLQYSPHGEVGIPASADVVTLDGRTMAVYLARGKFDSKTVGGVSTIRPYNGIGQILYNDPKYTPTGASQLVAVSSEVFAHVFDDGGTKLTVRFYNVRCQRLGETSIPKENFYGSQIGTQFAAYYDKTANLVRVFYVDVSSSRTFSRFDVSPVTFAGTVAASAATNVGPASSLNTDLRISRTSDERRVLIESANNAAGTLSTVSTFSTVGNVVPSAPALTTRPNFDATSAATFTWKFGDTNPADYQTKYQLEISRVSDSVVVYDSGAVTSTVSSATVSANTLVNAINYRWRVRTYDVINSVGTWSSYGTFTTAATGTLTITSPATDNLSPMETDDYTVTWSYVQSGGQTQAQRQVRVIRTSDSAVIANTTMQANTSNSYYVSGMESGKEYRVEVSLINSAAIAVPVVSRLITPNYSQPMKPSLTINPKEAYIELTVTNPVPTGDRPEVLYNDIYRRVAKAGSMDSDFKRIAIISNSETYRDYAIKSGASYEYFVTSRTL